MLMPEVLSCRMTLSSTDVFLPARQVLRRFSPAGGPLPTCTEPFGGSMGHVPYLKLSKVFRSAWVEGGENEYRRDPIPPTWET